MLDPTKPLRTSTGLPVRVIDSDGTWLFACVDEQHYTVWDQRTGVYAGVSGLWGGVTMEQCDDQ